MTDVTQYSTAEAQKILEQDAYIERIERMNATTAARIVQLEAQLAAVPVSTLRYIVMSHPSLPIDDRLTAQRWLKAWTVAHD